MKTSNTPIWAILEQQGISAEDLYENRGKVKPCSFMTQDECDEHNERMRLMTFQEFCIFQESKGILRPTKQPHTFITISLPAEDFEKDFSDDVKKCMNRNSAMLNGNSYMFNLEFFGKKGELHPHTHILIKGGGMDKSKIIRAFSRQFKIKDNFVDVQRSDCGRLYAQRVGYIKGEKQESKMKGVEKDDEFRKKYGIDKFYESI